MHPLKQLALSSVVAGLGAGIPIGSAIMKATTTTSDYDKARERSKNIKTPCQYEDSVNCLWDAEERGNRVGDSFTAVLIRDKVYVFYTNGQVIVDNVYRGDNAPE